MKGHTNMNGVSEQGQSQFELLPEGTYTFEITEKTDKLTKDNQDPMINIKLVVSDGVHKGKYVYDNIIIPNEGSPAFAIKGRTKHFLHCIGEEYEGEFDWDSDNWQYRLVKAEVKHEQPNQYHKYIKPIISQYLLDDTLAPVANDDPL